MYDGCRRKSQENQVDGVSGFAKEPTLTSPELLCVPKVLRIPWRDPKIAVLAEQKAVKRRESQLRSK